MALALSNEELLAMEGLTPFQKCVYIFGIRQFMNYKTGWARVSHLSIAKQLFIAEGRGVEDSGLPHDSKVRRAVSFLKKKGLITQEDSRDALVLKCNFARWDNSISNKPDTNPTLAKKVKPDTVYKSAKSVNTAIRSKIDAIPDMEPDTSSDVIPDTIQVSGLDLTTKQLHTDHQDHTENNIRSPREKNRADFVDKLEGFVDFWKLYPHQKAKAAAQKKWVTKKCAEIKELILENIRWRLINEWEPMIKAGKKSFIPRAPAYLNQERWNDEREHYIPGNKREEKENAERTKLEQQRIKRQLEAELRQITAERERAEGLPESDNH